MMHRKVSTPCANDGLDFQLLHYDLLAIDDVDALL